MSDDPHIVKPPTSLSDKVAMGGAGGVDFDMLEQAELVLNSMTSEYIEWAKGDIERLETAINTLKSDGGGTKKNLNAVFKVAHDIKGQGGSFGFNLMTDLGSLMCLLIENLDTVDSRRIEAMQIYITAMKHVLTNEIKGSGGADGVALLSGLESMKEKILSKATS